jgi:catechol 2,3-dioxygenase-like lactoylglutathione lyase family enzyme
MSTTETSTGTPPPQPGDMRIEVVVIPVSDVDRAKEFYERLGWRLDANVSTDDGFRLVQFTPPGSLCSVQFGTNLTSAEPGSAQSLYLVDVEAARDDLVARGVDVSELFDEGKLGDRFHHAGMNGRVDGPATARPTARSPRSATRTATDRCSRRHHATPGTLT